MKNVNRRGFLQMIGLSPAAVLLQPEQEALARSNLLHEGLQRGRLNRFPERIYAERWKGLNVRKSWQNHGFTFLEWIMCPDGCRVPPEVSERDAQVAASVIQWLGTNCGMGFMSECEKRIKLEQENEWKKRRTEANRD